MDVKSILHSPLSIQLNSRFEAEILLAAILNVSRTTLFSRFEQLLNLDQQALYESWVKRRLKGEPIAYITGFKEFWSLSFVVSPAVLIPRPETEHLIEEVLKKFPNDLSNIEVLELGTGSGALAIALSVECPNWKITAIDRSKEALSIAKQNAERLTKNPIQFYLSDWFSYFKTYPKQFNAIISNPPYIAPEDIHLKQPDLCYEPKEALVAELNGLQAIRQIIKQASYYLLSKGWLMLEHGYDQGQEVRNLMQDSGFTEIKTIRDLSNHDRITIGCRP